MSRDGNGPSATEDVPERETLREGLRRGILDALALELDRTSARTVGRLAAAGALGIAGAQGSVALFSGGLLANGHHGWYVAICAAVWAGFLVACSSVALLRIQIQRIPLTQACVLALVGLGLAALLAVLCPDPHPLTWWSATSVGRLAIDGGGPGAGAFCLGACSALLIGTGAGRRVGVRGALRRLLGGRGAGPAARPLAPRPQHLIGALGRHAQSTQRPRGRLLHRGHRFG